MKRTLALVALILLPLFGMKAARRPLPAFQPMCDSLKSYLSKSAFVETRLHVNGASVAGGRLNLIFSSALSEYPLRHGDVRGIYSIIDSTLPGEYGKYAGKVTVRSSGKTLEELVSNYFSSDRYNQYVKDHIRRMEMARTGQPPLVTRLSSPVNATEGLQGRHIALWQSHGYYYEGALQRWEWQRSRLMQTVEDLYTQGYVIPFLLPMLENAGANVLMPRERDWNTAELIVDNDTPWSGYSESGSWSEAPAEGFCHEGGSLVNGQNPFTAGTARITRGAGGNPDGESTASWLPDFPQKGRYAVYVSYQTLGNSTGSARYEVIHSGGSTHFSVNQKMGGGTWICLGFFDFDAGGSSQGVKLTNAGSDPDEYVSCDAVKFGGGMGNIARTPFEAPFDVEPEISGYPRAAEGSRYWLQWAGFTDTIYSPTAFERDYTDDYRSRGKWVNAMAGGSCVNPDKPGYNIPIDLSLAFHTDAGVSSRDSTIGTLAIYTRVFDGKDSYPNGEMRDIARDYADVVQSQIVSDIRAGYDSLWTRRGLRDKLYAECGYPDVPSMILELLSHQNFNDMRFGLDPGFRFLVSRAIYKGILKFLAYINGLPCVVQPLPVRDFCVSLEPSAGDTLYALLKWKPCDDPLEPSAAPAGYIVRTRIEDGGFDNGFTVDECCARVPLERGKIYSFKVAAFNTGGVSFDSEILCAGEPLQGNGRRALIVNNFDRISGPVCFETSDSLFAGFLNSRDGGVPYIEDITCCGPQYEFRRSAKWIDDDSGGFGASHGTLETTVAAGNTFDFPFIHAGALLKAGYSFASCSRGAFMDGTAAGQEEGGEADIPYSDYNLLDIICGKQTATVRGLAKEPDGRYSVFPAQLQLRLAQYASSGGSILISGAYVASDVWDPIYGFPADSSALHREMMPTRAFVTNILKYKWMSTQATTTGKLRSVASPAPLKAGKRYSFHTVANPVRYHVESPDAIVPVEESNAFTIFRYDNNLSAGVAYLGEDYKAVTLGFPIESLVTMEETDSLLLSLLQILE